MGRATCIVELHGKYLRSTMYASCFYRLKNFPNFVIRIQVKKRSFVAVLQEMALLGCGWGLGRGLISLAGVGFVFHLGRKVLHLERMVLKLEDEKEKLRDLNTEAVQGVEWIKEILYVAEIEKAEYAVLHQEASKELLSVQLQNSQGESHEKELSREVEWLKGKLAVAEMRIAEHAAMKKEADKDLMLLQSQKQELESSLHSALEKLQRREQELVAAGAQNRRLELSLYSAVEKVIKTEGKIDVLLAQKTQLIEQLKGNQQAFEAYVKEVKIFMAMSFEKVEHGKETESTNPSLESVADGNTQLQKQVKELLSQSKDGEMVMDAQTCELQNHSELPAMLVQSTEPSLRDFAQAPELGSFDCILEHQARSRHQGDEISLPNSERSNKGKEKATGSSASMYQEEDPPSETSKGRRKLALTRIISLKSLVSSCFSQGNENVLLGRKNKGGFKKDTEKKKVKIRNPPWRFHL